MEQTERKLNPTPKLGAVKRKAVALAEAKWVEESVLLSGESLPLLMQPAVDGLDPCIWATHQRAHIAASLLKHGGILFRGFKIDSVANFEQFVAAFRLAGVGYYDQHTPRTKLTSGVYTSTEYPADHYVPFHSENSKNHVWPMKIWFGCLRPAEQGGETPIADNRLVFQLVPTQIRERFIEKKVMYVRNFGEGAGLSWQTAFQTDDRKQVERQCREASMEFEWKDGNRLRVRHVRPSVTVHPTTGAHLWFNQAHLFHVSNLTPDVRASLHSLFTEEDLPSNSYYGDGTPIEDSVLDEVREAFRQASTIFPWQAGDVLMLDNMLVAHSRTPFTGERKVVVAMADSFGGGELTA